MVCKIRSCGFGLETLRDVATNDTSLMNMTQDSHLSSRAVLNHQSYGGWCRESLTQPVGTFFKAFNFEITLDLWKSCRRKREFPYTLCPASSNVNILLIHAIMYILMKK